jgi:hypothetical protein
MYEATREVLDCETNSSYKGQSFRPYFTLLWTNWPFLYHSCHSSSPALLLAWFPHCITYGRVLNLSTEIKVTSYQPHHLLIWKGLTIMFLFARRQKSVATVCK